MGMAGMKDCLTAQDVLAGCSIKHACYGGFGGLIEQFLVAEMMVEL